MKLLIALGFILLSVNAVPYPDFFDKSSDVTIPYCLNQLGWQCLVCGPIKDSNDTAKIVPTAPNALFTACLPSRNGCSEFKDMKGEICNNQCFCGYNLNANKICIPQVIDNCVQLDATGKKCTECISPLMNYNFGGGINDYGISFEQTLCIDNIANGRPNCQRYRNGDQECGSCRNTYFLTADFNCIKQAVGLDISNACLFIEKDGKHCSQCKPGYTINALWGCDQILGVNQVAQPECVRYGLSPNGVDYDYTVCLQCEPGRFLTEKKRCGNKIDGPNSGTFYLENGFNHANMYPRPNCAIISDVDDTISLCVLSKDDPYVKPYYAIPPPGKIEFNYCLDYDNANQICKKPENCLAPSVYDKLQSSCVAGSCQNVNCLESEGNRWCNRCREGYMLYEGLCYEKPTVVTSDCAEWDPTTYVCTKCVEQYTLDPIKFTCKVVTIIGCQTWVGDQCTECVVNKKLSEDKLSCVWNVPEAFGGVYGCKEHSADLICKTCFDHFLLSEDKKSCTFHLQKTTNCAIRDAKGTCTLCNNIKYSLYVDLFGVQSCLEVAGNYCETTFDKCHCISCKPGTSFDDKGNCIFPLSANPNTLIEGCIKFKSSTQCEVCQVGHYLLTTDQKCYNLQQSRMAPMMNKNLPESEPCKVAQNVNECTECESGAVGLISWTTSILVTPRSFCIFNYQDEEYGPSNQYFDSSAAVGDSIFTPIKWCKKYVTDNKYGTVCDVCHDGREKSTGGKDCVDKADKLFFDHCKSYSATDNGCTECDVGYVLQPDQTCEQFSIYFGCLTVDTTTNQCSQCLPGFQLDTFSTNGNQNTCVQAENIEQDDCSKSVVEKAAGSCLPIKINIIQDPAQAAGFRKFETVECSKGTKLNTVTKFCEVDTSVQKNCAVVNKWAGFCEQCKEGYFLHIGDMYDNSNVLLRPQRYNSFLHNCIPHVPDCIQYKDFTMRCTQCKPTVDGKPQIPDGAGWNCLTADNMLQNCDTYVRGDLTKCFKCQVNTGVEAENCKVPIENCKVYNSETQICTTCDDGFVKSSKGLCVVNLVKNCQTPYDSTLCAECKSTHTLIPTKDNKISKAYGLCVLRSIEGCVLANADNTKCLRCEKETYAILDGVCVQNDGSEQFPWNCINYAYNITSRSPYCSQCDQGFGIAKNNTRCLINSGPCVDSVDSDCFEYQNLGPYETKNKCKSFSRPGSSASLSLAILSLLIIMLTF